MGYVIQTQADRSAIKELPLTAIKTNPQLQNRNVGMQKFRDDNDAKRYKGHAKDIAGDIQRQGQLTPIKVVVADDTDSPRTDYFWLVDGHHRLEAVLRLGQKTIKVEVVGGRGFNAAQTQSRLANSEIVQGLSRVERTENTWSALNQPGDYFRAMKVADAAKVLCISDATIKRMRKCIMGMAVRAQAVDLTLSKPERNAQFMVYWEEHRAHFFAQTWGIVEREESVKDESTMEMLAVLKRALVQAALGDFKRYDIETIQRGFKELAEESKGGIKSLEKRYKPTVAVCPFGDPEEDEQLLKDVKAAIEQMEASSDLEPPDF